MFVGPLRRLPASASESRSCPSWATHNGSVYLFGGYDGGGARPKAAAYVCRAQMFVTTGCSLPSKTSESLGIYIGALLSLLMAHMFKLVET